MIINVNINYEIKIQIDNKKKLNKKNAFKSSLEYLSRMLDKQNTSSEVPRII